MICARCKNRAETFASKKHSRRCSIKALATLSTGLTKWTFPNNRRTNATPVLKSGNSTSLFCLEDVSSQQPLFDLDVIPEDLRSQVAHFFSPDVSTLTKSSPTTSHKGNQTSENGTDGKSDSDDEKSLDESEVESELIQEYDEYITVSEEEEDTSSSEDEDQTNFTPFLKYLAILEREGSSKFIKKLKVEESSSEDSDQGSALANGTQEDQEESNSSTSSSFTSSDDTTSSNQSYSLSRDLQTIPPIIEQVEAEQVDKNTSQNLDQNERTSVHSSSDSEDSTKSLPKKPENLVVTTQETFPAEAPKKDDFVPKTEPKNKTVKKAKSKQKPAAKRKQKSKVRRKLKRVSKSKKSDRVEKTTATPEKAKSESGQTVLEKLRGSLVLELFRSYTMTQYKMEEDPGFQLFSELDSV